MDLEEIKAVHGQSDTWQLAEEDMIKGLVMGNWARERERLRHRDVLREGRL